MTSKITHFETLFRDLSVPPGLVCNKYEDNMNGSSCSTKVCDTVVVPLYVYNRLLENATHGENKNKSIKNKNKKKNKNTQKHTKKKK